MSDENPQGDYLWDGAGTPTRRSSASSGSSRATGVSRRCRRCPRARSGARPVPQRRDAARRRRGVARARRPAAWFAASVRQAGWTVQSLEGNPVVAGVPIGAPSRLPIGEVITTDERSRARIDVSDDRLRGRRAQQRAAPARVRGRASIGLRSIAARSAPASGRRRASSSSTPPHPRRSISGAPTRCRWTTEDSAASSSRAGWVAFEHKGRESFNPQNAICLTRPGTGPGTPCYVDAPNRMQQALTILDFEATDDVRRAEALETVLSSARRKTRLPSGICCAASRGRARGRSTIGWHRSCLRQRVCGAIASSPGIAAPSTRGGTPSGSTARHGGVSVET
jgi:hypothetical protein